MPKTTDSARAGLPVPDSDDWMSDPVMQRAALTGWARNPAVPLDARLLAALQVIGMYEAEQAVSGARPKAPQDGGA